MSDGKYSTTDFYTTAVLISQNFEVTEISREGPNQKVKRFHFVESDTLREVIRKYVNGQLHGDLRNFKNSIESVKDMVHSA